MNRLEKFGLVWVILSTNFVLEAAKSGRVLETVLFVIVFMAGYVLFLWGDK